jgi:hypothetical protein
MNILELLQTVENNWPLLVFVFTLGGAWWQGAVWFRRVNISLDRANRQHAIQHTMLTDIKSKTENLEQRIDKIEIITVQIHEELHEQEIKLAVIETTHQAKRRQSKI